MKHVIPAVFLFIVAAVSSAQGIRPAPRSPRPHVTPTPIAQAIIVPPPCDPAKLIDLLDEYFAPAVTLPLEPEYCAPRTCEAQEKAKKFTKDAALLQAIDLMRKSCRTYFPS